MPSKNGNTTKILAFLERNPGANSSDIKAACGVAMSSGLLSWLVAKGRVHAAGPHHWQRYYLDREQALAAHERICRKAVEQRRVKAKLCARVGNLRKRARRLEMQRKAASTRRADICHVEAGVAISPAVRITVAPRPSPGKYTVTEPPRIFGSLALGNYLPFESAIARAYPVTTNGA